MKQFLVIDKKPNLAYVDMMERFLMNVVAFSVALVTKDYSTFSPEVLEMMESNPEWLKETVAWGQQMLAQSVVDGENYLTNEEMAEDLSGLIVLYNTATQRELTDREDALFTNLHDRFLTLLLVDDELIKHFLEDEQ
ncbi:DUF3206 domain-containing protein [Enterococcus diestrammenae]|uniref:Uncharacterized protein n=1 Tax=Enterococcus diestrammenae TaxID=1155073 RepID=A0ABV0F800_9ENTE|nr:DUF3206 domain-containing protein [Enterococcus diestrammenae]KAF1296975.1 DUF3206 domain-containing protein [Enterococcus diestrammenae]